MDKIIGEYFIHGKFGQGEGAQEYRITACSSKLEGIKFENFVKNYRFWKHEPRNDQDHKAIGIFPGVENIKAYENTKHLIIAQLQPPMKVDGNNLIRRAVARYFRQHRYVFIKEADLTDFRYNILELLMSLSAEAIPVQKLDSSLRRSIEIPRVEPLEIELTTQELLEWKNQVISLIRDFIENNDTQRRDLLLKAISVLVSNSNARILFGTWKKAQEITFSYIQSIYLLLPAIYRSQISLVIGYIDEKNCRQANLMVSLINQKPRCLPRGYEWFNSEQTIYSNLEEEVSQVTELEYVKALRKFFSEKPDESRISQLVNELDDKKLDKLLAGDKATLQTLRDNPSVVLRQVPSLSSNRDNIIAGLKEYLKDKPELIHRLDQVCNLNLNRWEDIKSLLTKLSEEGTLKTVLKFLEELFNEKIWNCQLENNLKIVKKFRENTENFSLAELLNYTQSEPDEWGNLKPIAKLAFPNYNSDYLTFIDLTLNCSIIWREKFSLQVLYEWVSLAAQEPKLLNQFSQETTFAWHVFQENPSKYIDELLKKAKSVHPSPEKIINVLIDCLPKISAENSQLLEAREIILQEAREIILQHVLELMESSSTPHLMFKLFRIGFDSAITNKEWHYLSQKIFTFPRELVDFITGYLFPIDSIEINEKYKIKSIESARKIAEELKDAEETHLLLENCVKLQFNKEECFNIVMIILKCSENDSSIINKVFLQLPTLVFDANYSLDKNIVNTDKFDKFFNVSPKVIAKVNERRRKSFFVNLIYNFLQNQNYKSLKYCSNLFLDNEKYYYYDYFDRASYEFIKEQSEKAYFDKIIPALSSLDLDLNKESELFKKNYRDITGQSEEKQESLKDNNEPGGLMPNQEEIRLKIQDLETLARKIIAEIDELKILIKRGHQESQASKEGIASKSSLNEEDDPEKKKSNFNMKEAKRNLLDFPQ